MPELVNRDGDDKCEPDSEGGWDVLIDTGEQQDVLRFVDAGRFRLQDA